MYMWNGTCIFLAKCGVNSIVFCYLVSCWLAVAPGRCGTVTYISLVKYDAPSQLVNAYD